MAADAPKPELAVERRMLSPSIRLRLVYRDDNPGGSPVSERCEREMRRRLAVLYAYRRQYGLAQLVRESSKVLERVLDRCLEGIRLSPDRLDADWLYPRPERVQPVQLCVERALGEEVARIPLDPALTAGLAGYLGEWQLGATPPTASAARALWDSLSQAGAMIAATQAERPPLNGVRYLGHAMLQIGDGRSSLLVDPYLLPRSERYPPDWQPPALEEIGRPDAILVTHSHPDHFDPGSLLRCGADTPIFVPAVERESVLSIDMAARLRQLGFQRVETVSDWQSFAVEGLRVQALPFHGEQPTVDDCLHPEVRNQGAAYRIEAAGLHCTALADCGRDRSGDIRDTASRARQASGAVDTVFGGYRGFALYPVQYAFSSVSRYLPFVPAHLWGARQQIMCDADDLIDVGERWGARRIVPYAAGGAPWYWMLGLGPCLDGSMPDAISTDPPPESVRDAAARRGLNRDDGAIASPVEVLPLRVGDRLPPE